MKLATAGAAVLLVAYLGEAALRIPGIRSRLRSPEHVELRNAASQAGAAFDDRLAEDFVRALRGRGEPVFAHVGPVDWLLSNGLATPDGGRVFPLAGVASRTTVPGCSELGHFTLIPNDEYGFNNPPGSWTMGGENVDLVLIGDSFAHGFCLDAGSDVGSRLRRSGWRIVNLGRGGNGPLAELAILLEYGVRVSPTLVLWMHSWNDLIDLRREQGSELLKRYLEPGFGQHLWSRRAEIDRLVTKWAEARMAAYEEEHGTLREVRGFLGLRTIRDLVRWTARRPGRLLPSPEAEVALLARILRRARDTVSAHGGTLWFAYIPSHGGDPRDQREAILAVARELGLQTVDLEPTLRMHPDPLALTPNRSGVGHFSERGYALLAETIRTAIVEKGALPAEDPLDQAQPGTR